MIERHATEPGTLHPLRAQDLTASDAPAAIGESPFKTPLELYAEKTGHLMPNKVTPVMLRGLDMEYAAVAKMRREQPDWDVVHPLNLYIRDPELRLGATPDALRKNPDGTITNLQIKVVNRSTFDKEFGSGEAPLHYILQTLTEGMLLDAKNSIIVVLVVDYASLELFYFDVDRNPQAEAKLIEHARAFWDNVATGKRPAADYKRDAATLTALFPQSVPEPVLDLSGLNELPDMLAKLKTYEAEIDARKVLIEEIKVAVKDKMGTAERAELPGWKISWKTQHAKERIQPAYDYRPLKITAVKIKEQAEDKAA